MERRARGDEASRDGRVLEGVRVLLVEDDPDGREALQLVLQHAGAQVTACGSAAVAWRELASRPQDVIVTDVRLPREDGESLLRRVRALPGAGGWIPIVALTGESRTLTGFDRVLPKPVDLDVLIDAVTGLAGLDPRLRPTD